MKGYKVFNSDWTCRGFQYNVGEIYNYGTFTLLVNADGTPMLWEEN